MTPWGKGHTVPSRDRDIVTLQENCRRARASKDVGTAALLAVPGNARFIPSYRGKGTKTGVTRRMAVHPGVGGGARGVEALGLGRRARPRACRRRPHRPNARGNVKDSHEAQDQLVADLELLELRIDACEYRRKAMRTWRLSTLAAGLILTEG